MAQELTLEGAAKALRRHYGGKGLEAGRQDGLALLSNALRQEAGISKQEADRLVRELDAANMIHWVPRGVATPEPQNTTEDTVPGTVERQDGDVDADEGAQGHWMVTKPS